MKSSREIRAASRRNACTTDRRGAQSGRRERAPRAKCNERSPLRGVEMRKHIRLLAARCGRCSGSKVSGRSSTAFEKRAGRNANTCVLKILPSGPARWVFRQPGRAPPDFPNQFPCCLSLHSTGRSPSASRRWERRGNSPRLFATSRNSPSLLSDGCQIGI